MQKHREFAPEGGPIAEGIMSSVIQQGSIETVVATVISRRDGHARRQALAGAALESLGQRPRAQHGIGRCEPGLDQALTPRP